MSKLLRILLMMSVLALGFVLSFEGARRSFDGEYFLSAERLLTRPDRDLAAFKKELQRSGLEDHLLISTSPLKALGYSRLIKKDSVFQLWIGHFSTKNKRGDPVFACQLYDQVTVTYEAPRKNKDSNFESPQTMFIDIPCKMADNDVRRLAPANLSPAEILKEAPSDGTFPFSNQGEFLVRLQNIDDEWPRQWFFKSIQFKDTHALAPTIEVNSSELGSAEKQRLNMDWSTIK